MSERIDSNVVRNVDSGVLCCAHCGYQLGNGHEPENTGSDYEAMLVMVDGPVRDAGPQIAGEPAAYLETAVIFRRWCCPGCMTAFRSSVIPVGDVR